ncbi:hypothetical protein AMTR_s00096p00152260 [Amborella trichopoda]|uniref:Uncharacterized protein n=1 Tax=Amborella trichopoda TaxID=13333 RepID=W1NXT3_AMBTC|nr:hypothetical protein AMTR_s00096p00152260 [Amborella trichopoda]
MEQCENKTKKTIERKNYGSALSWRAMVQRSRREERRKNSEELKKVTIPTGKFIKEEHYY